MPLLPPKREGATVEDIKLACLRVGSAFYALDIMVIREIIRPMPIMPVPRAPAFVDGVIILRKAVIPVVDLRHRFGVELQVEPRERIIICAVDGKVIGLLADEVSEVATFTRDNIQPAPYFMSGSNSQFFPGVCRYKGHLLILINLRAILASDQIIDASHLQQEMFEETMKD